jgi:hypothetical protein
LLYPRSLSFWEGWATLRKGPGVHSPDMKPSRPGG